MKFKKIIIMCIVFIILTVLICMNLVNFINISSSNDVLKNKNEINQQQKLDELNQIQEIVKEEIETTENIDEKDVVEIVKEKESIIVNENKIESKDEKTTKTDNNVQKEQTKKEEVKEEKKEEIEIPEKHPWDELGISEDDYYNKPMWNWARIDYSINEYKTYEKTREACMKKGEELFEEGFGYSCTSINSYSGKYLGEMLKTF